MLVYSFIYFITNWVYLKNKIIFVGGIHGVGKSTLCKESATSKKIQYVSASDIIRQYKTIQLKDKSVQKCQINKNQDLLLHGIKLIKMDNTILLLDGHFILFDEDNIPSKIPIDTFKKIQPACIIIIVDDPKKIAFRLLERDKKKYSIELLNKMQDDELRYASDIANTLNIPISKVNFNDTNYFNMLVNKQIQLNGV